MKTFYFLFLFLIIYLNCNGQVVAIGHVYAEVIESVSSKYSVSTDFVIKQDSTKINIGTITITSTGNNLSNVIISQAIINSGQNIFNIVASDNTINGSKTVEISGNKTNEKISTDDVGIYSVNLVYN